MITPTRKPSTTQPRRLRTAWPVAVVCLASLSACSTFEETKVDYTSAKRVSSLEVPPDLTQLNRETRFAVPGNVVTASGYQASAPNQTVTTAANEVGDVRMERAGNQRWIVVKRPADKLWQPMRDFWQGVRDLPEEERRAMLVEHGRMGRDYPDVRANTVSAFALGDYEWILAFEADELHRIVDLMRHLRGSQARLHVREEIPFYTGPRVGVEELVARLP
jgi:chlorite dismutase